MIEAIGMLIPIAIGISMRKNKLAVPSLQLTVRAS